jgi:uncharacterized protein with NRDE domain
VQKRIFLRFGCFLLIAGLFSNCGQNLKNKSGQQLFTTGKKLFLKAKNKKYNLKLFRKAHNYLVAAKAKDYDNPELDFMLGTTFNLVYKDWDKASYYLDQAKNKYSKQKNKPLEYYKVLYNLSNSLLRLQEPKVEVAKGHLMEINNTPVEKLQLTDAEKKELKNIQRLALKTLKAMRM